MFDLLLTGGRVIDPAADRDEVADVAFTDGRVAAVGKDLGPAKEKRDVTGRMVVPGLIDLHTHVYWGGTSLGVDPDIYAKPCGITTLVDAGSAGPGNFAGFRRHVIERSEVRILPFLHISFPGIFGVSKYFSYGESADLMMLDPRAFLDVARDNRDLIVGTKVRIGKVGSGAVGAGALAIALEAAEHSGLPLMVHLDRPPPHRTEVMPKLRRGDIWTHCFRAFPNAPLTYDGEIQDDILAARERGVIFDIGHGRGSFGFATAKKMMEHGFSPDVISSDVHVMSVNGPAFNLIVTMSKFMALGFPLREIIRTCTINAAQAVRREDRGTLKPGLLGDATVLDIEQGKFEFFDAPGAKIEADRQFVCRGAVLGGNGGIDIAMIEWTVAVPTFLAASVEWVEAFTIVLAVSLSIGWVAAVGAAGAALVTLAVMTVVTGGALSLGISLYWLQLVIGIFLLLFGVRWLAKAIARHAGLKALHDEAAEFNETRAQLADGDWYAGWIIAFKGVLLEGLEVWLIVVALGMHGGWRSSAGAAIVALLLVAAVGMLVRAPLARVPENAIKFVVGAMIVSFGTFWTLEAIGGAGVWPGGDWSLLGLVVFYAGGGLVVATLMRRPAGIGAVR